jgi:uncharacterized protein YyaL (SSP411 family)
VESEGNWEHGNNILFINEWESDFVKEKNIAPAELHRALEEVKEKLLVARSKRIRPGLDDKVLTGWNAMTIHGLLDAYAAFEEPLFLDMAISNIEFLEKNLIDKKVYRSFKGKRSPVEGFLEDYAFLIQAYLSLYQSTFNEDWLDKAKQWTEYAQDYFFDPSDGYYHFSSNQAEELIARKKDIFDNVIPSANGVMARNLFHLGIILDNQNYQAQAQKMVSQLGTLIESEPTYMSHWALLYSEMISPMAEIVVVGPQFIKVAQGLRKNYLPFSLLMGTSTSSDLPLIQEKSNPPDKEVTIYVCFNKTCKLPVHTLADALGQLPKDHLIVQ